MNTDKHCLKMMCDDLFVKGINYEVCPRGFSLQVWPDEVYESANFGHRVEVIFSNHKMVLSAGFLVDSNAKNTLYGIGNGCLQDAVALIAPGCYPVELKPSSTGTDLVAEMSLDFDGIDSGEAAREVLVSFVETVAKKVQEIVDKARDLGIERAYRERHPA